MARPANPNHKPSRQERWATKHGLARWAHIALRNGVRRGLIEKKPCEVCGSIDAEAHHDDYDRPLAVRWLCRAHHKALHASTRRRT
jgi:hypothetical protein